MDVKRLVINGIGAALGGGLMYALVRKTGAIRARTLSSTVVEGSAIFGGASLGYFLSNIVASKVFGEANEVLPPMQAESLPSGDKPVETPTAETAMGNVAAKAQAVNAVTPIANANDIEGGQVIDITKAKG